MRKRPRRRRPKRSGSTQESQRSQKLSKKVQELYRTAGAEDSDSEWQVELEKELEKPGRSRRVRSTRTAPPREAAGAGIAEPPATGRERQGLVISITSGACRVEADDEVFDCILPSELARDQRATVAVGDQILFASHGERSYRVSRVLPRRTLLSRPDPQNPHRERVIAANVDVAIHVASVVRPPLRPALIDRYLIAIERGGAEALLAVNKIDLLPEPEQRRRELAKLASYRDLGCDICPCSATTGEGLDTLRAKLAGRTAVFVGHSGVGKSSLLNALEPQIQAATGAVDESLGKGRHTTTRSNLYSLAGDIRVIDTPGIREFGLWKLTPQALRFYFPEFEDFARTCRFNDCGHHHEPQCTVREAVSTGSLPAARYETYLRILASLGSDLDRA